MDVWVDPLITRMQTAGNRAAAMGEPRLISHLAELMEAKGINGKQLSEASGVSDAVITRMRRNHFTQLDMGCVAKLCAALEVGPGEMFSLTKS